MGHDLKKILINIYKNWEILNIKDLLKVLMAICKNGLGKLFIRAIKGNFKYKGHCNLQ